MPPVKTKAQIDAEAIAPGRQPTAPYNGWAKRSPAEQAILTNLRGWDQARFDSSDPASVKARELAAKYPLNASSFNNRLLDKGIPMVGAGAPPAPPAPQTPMTANKATVANIGSFVGNMAGSTMGGMTGLPINALNSAASATQATPAPAPAPAPTANKQGSAMTDKQMFKVAFLAKCIEEGLTIDEMKLRVKQALYFVEKKANWGALGELIRTVPALALGTAALTAGGGYYAGKHILGPGIHEAFKAPLPDKEDLLKEEIINEYDRQAETIKRQAELTRRRRERDRGMSGITRY